MATAFSQAALAEAKRAMDKAEADVEKAENDVQELRNAWQNFNRKAQAELEMIAYRQQEKQRVCNRAIVARETATKDYYAMIALSKQQG